MTPDLPRAKADSLGSLRNHRKCLTITAQLLCEIVGIEGLFNGVEYNPSTDTIKFYFYGPGEPLVPEGGEATETRINRSYK